MISTESFWRAGVTVRTGYAEYLAANPTKILLTATLPRAVLQCLFFTLLGRAAAGSSGAEFAFIGAVGLGLSVSTVASIGDVPMLEKWSGTYYRLQRAALSPGTTFLLRTLPWISEGTVAAILSIVIVGSLTGQGTLAAKLLLALPLYVVMALTSAAAGSAIAALAVGRRADVLLGNSFMYLLMVSTGVLIPADQAPWLDRLAQVLPLRNGILAVRGAVDGAPWIAHLVAELAVGITWAVLTGLLYRSQSRRATRLGIDDYA